MVIYAVIDTTNLVIGLSQLSGTVNQPDMIEIPAYDETLVGKVWDGANFVAAPPKPVLTITLDAGVAAVGATVTAAADVSAGGTLVPLTGTYHVPVMAIDGRMDQLLTVNILNGQATVPMTFANPGIYTLDMSKIRPVPTAELSASPEVIIT